MNTLPPEMADFVMTTILEKWSGKGVSDTENWLKQTPGMYEAFFCQHNEYEAAKKVFVGGPMPQGVSKKRFIKLAKVRLLAESNFSGSETATRE